MINGVIQTNPINSTYESSYTKINEVAIKETEYDTVDIGLNDNSFNYAILLMRERKPGTDVEEGICSVSLKYKEFLDEINESSTSDEEKMIRTSNLNWAFEKVLIASATEKLQAAKNVEGHNMAFAEFAKNNHLVGGTYCDNLKEPEKLEKVMSNHKDNMKTINNYNNTVKAFVSVYYEEFINSLEEGNFECSYENSLEKAKQKDLHTDYTYQQYVDFIEDDINNLGKDSYWFKNENK